MMGDSARLQIVAPEERVDQLLGMPGRRRSLWLKEGRKCHWCGMPTRMCPDPVDDQATIEHIIPRGQGGSDHDDNLASACRACNMKRNEADMLKLKKPDYYQHIVTRKSQIMMENILREQRDQAQKEIQFLRKEMKHYTAAIEALEQERAAMTVNKLIRQRVGRWIQGA